MKEFKQVGTATGRLSSPRPNLQNIPVPKTKDGQAAKKAFLGGGVVEVPVSFSVIKHAVAKQFELMKQHTLYRVDLSNAGLPINALTMDGPVVVGLSTEQRMAITGDKLWDAYLAAFPEGTDPIFRERTDHDCSCCKHFIRTMGGVVALIDGSIVTIWDGLTEGFYIDVQKAMRELVRSAPIDNIFLHTEKSVGTGVNFQQLVDHGTAATTTISWEHFHLHLPASVVVKKDAIGPKQSEVRSTFDVFKRGLEELTLDAVDTVLELIAQNSLYRGAEYKGILEAFRTQMMSHRKLIAQLGLDLADQDELDRRVDSFIWFADTTAAVKRIRNTAIGTLLIDLSDGKELEDAVKKFETSIMAPSNYKRPTALVSKAMIAKAAAKVEELGFTSALERRYAVLEDITVNNVLFANRTTRLRPYQQSAFDALAAAVPESKKSLGKVEEISIEKFLADVLPKATDLEVMVENAQQGNFVSLIAPVDPGAKIMFKWPNNFSWSYAGDVADSIKERVKKAGGSVVGDLCCRLAWDYTDDLDFHMIEPTGGTHIYFSNRRTRSRCGGMLDLDANGSDGFRADPAENIVYASKSKMLDGIYELRVNNYVRRSTGIGFQVEVEFGGTTHSFAYDKVIRNGETITVANIEYTRKDGFEIINSLPSSTASKQVWGITTGTFHKVNVVMLSPNYWDIDTTNSDIERSLRSGVGNKHYFFILDGCKNEDRTRGFYNEFLSSALEPHRKTMEMVGAKMKTEESERQLSGVGFSSTQRASLLVRVKGSFNRVVRVTF